MDYADTLRQERTKAHAIFHSVILELPNYTELTTLLFFEGEDDPSFYFPHIRAINSSRDYLTFICNGRIEVIKALDLISEDGRAIYRSLFFIDKDHNDLVGTQKTHPNLFQTTYYSIENYLVNVEILSSYWVENLHLDTIDPRRAQFIEYFNTTYKSFNRKMLTLMALVLLARGYDSRPARKLNLNNVNFDLMFHLDFEQGTCKYLTGAGKHFALSTNVVEYGVVPKILNKNAIKKIINSTLIGMESKNFIRGKYELWFFIKFLQYMAHKLSSKSDAKLSGLKRATPKISLTKDSAIEHLGPRLRLPEDLRKFLKGILIDTDSISREKFELTSS